MRLYAFPFQPSFGTKFSHKLHLFPILRFLRNELVARIPISMSSPYDESLLASAPKATKAQLQDGYNPDLLAEKASSTPTSTGADLAAANLRSTSTQEERASLPHNEKKIPFYRTKKGIVVIVVVVIIVIAAVVGGAVGGTRKKKSSTDDLPPGIVFASSGASQGAGDSPTSSTVSDLAITTVAASSQSASTSSTVPELATTTVTAPPTTTTGPPFPLGTGPVGR